jgi:hypothetical protein
MNFGSIPPGVQKKIDATLWKEETFAGDVDGTPSAVTFKSVRGTRSDAYLKRCAAFVFGVWGALLPSAASRCPKLNSVVTLTPGCPKRLPVPWRPLGLEELNSGYTVHPCGDIAVYREEEWTKVFIHETFHLFGLDAVVDAEATFPWFPHKVALYEAYSETMARILHCEVVAALKGKKGREVQLLLKAEQEHSLEIMKRFLAYNGMVYSDLLTAPPPAAVLNYRENTNAFAYIVLTAMLLHVPKTKLLVSSPEELVRLVEAVRTSAAFQAKVEAARNLPVEGPIRMSVVRLFSSA